MRYSLSQEKWRLKGTDSYIPLRDKSMETGQVLRGITPWIDCQVPGGVALALYRAGWIEYPYFELNSLKCEWIENRWWIYETVLDRPNLQGTRFKLCFRGVDYHAYIYLNNQLLGEHEGMYEAFSFDITEEFRKSQQLKLSVVIRHAPDEMGQIGYTSMTHTQKSRFNYKWDFGTRLVNLGIWEDVEIVAENDYVLGDVALNSDVEAGCGLISCSGTVEANVPDLKDLTVTAEVSLNGTHVTQCNMPVEKGTYHAVLSIENPELWYPNGYGTQPLYDVVLQLRCGDEILDTRTYQQGIRRLRYLQNENPPQGALPYTFEVNGEKIYIKGVNMTPLDHIYGDIPEERYEATVKAMAAMNVNLVRVWGGGIIEKECFYRLCDQYGLMVWQEFIQSSSGIDNIPSKRPEFLKLLKETAVCAIKSRRNHTCLSAWSGGNELMDKDNIPSNYEDINIAMLKALVEELDPGRIMYPTSASGPNEWQQSVPGLSHDVHGDWKYRGNPRHYETYAVADNLFHSEFGCEGANGMKSMNRVLSVQRRKPSHMDVDDVWRFHGDWWCTYDRDMELFGKMEDLPEFVAGSQWIQAEAIRFVLEANRRRAFHNSGSIVWQFNEPWPNVSCTCLYSYFDDAKMAYFWSKKAYAPFHVSLDYRSLNPVMGSTFRGEVWLSADRQDTQPATVSAEVLDMTGKVLHRIEKTDVVNKHHSEPCMKLEFRVPDLPVYVVRVHGERGTERDDTCYFFSTAETEIYRPYRELPDPKLEVTCLETCENSCRYLVRNVGGSAAIHIHAMEAGDRFLILPEDDYFTLFPGESKAVNIQIRPRFAYGFDEYRDMTKDQKPDIRFQVFPNCEKLYD